MKSVLISIQPKWCDLIASGKKTVEVRKTKPKLETPFKCYIYETLGYKIKLSNVCKGTIYIGCGKVIGEFVCDKIYDINWVRDFEHGNWFWDMRYNPEDDCLTPMELAKYIGDKEIYYGWHISDLVIYDKPKELSEFWNADKCPYVSKDGCTYKYHCFRAGQTKRCGSTLKRPPQSWCYVERREG